MTEHTAHHPSRNEPAAADPSADQVHHREHAGAALSTLLELDAQVLAAYWDAALDWAVAACDRQLVRRVLDLGAGTGTGALGLAARLTGAEVIAVDVDAASLQRLRADAAAAGVAGRVQTVAADLDRSWPELGTLDLTWASMSLHHLAAPEQALRRLWERTRPGGALAVAEFAEPLRFLPQTASGVAAGFEERLLAVLAARGAEQMPTLGSQWGPRLAAAGWRVDAERDFVISLDPPPHPDSGRYARSWFARVSAGLDGGLDATDQAGLAALLEDGGAHAVLRQPLHIRGVRTVTVGVRD